MYHQIMTTIIWIHIHDVIHDVTKSQNRSYLKSIYLRQYLNYGVDQKLKMSEMLMAISLVYSSSGITSGKKKFVGLKKAAILKILKYQTQLQFDLRYEKIVPNYANKVFYGDDVIDDVTGWPQSFSLYSCLGEVGSGSKLQGQCLVNKCQYHNCLSRLCQKTISMNYTFRDCRSSMTSRGGLKVGPLYSFINEIITFFHDN